MPPSPHLSDRQLELLRLAGRGATDGEAARTLCISRHTVKAHWRIIFERFDPLLFRLKRERTKSNVTLVAVAVGVLSFADLQIDTAPPEQDIPHVLP